MHPREAAYVLAVAASYDKRTPSQAEALSWGADLGDITRAEAVDAVREHFRTRPDTYLAVGHVIAIVKRYRRVGLDQAHRVESVMLRDVDPDDVGAYLNTIHRARSTAAQGGSAIPTAAAAIGSKYSPADGQADRNRRGRAAVDAVLARHADKAPRADGRDPDQLTEADRIHAAALERARAEKSGRRRGDPERLGAVMARVRPTP